MPRQSRRDFVRQLSASAAVVSMDAWSIARADDPSPSDSPSEKLGVAVVGVRHRGGAHWGAFTSRPDTEVLWVVDVDANIGPAKVEEIAKRQRRKPRFTRDMREAFADPAVDIVTIATPNHWHALASIWAMQHGKDVYVEKPVSHNVSEGRRIVQAARKYNRICQVGTQSRSMSGLRQAMEYLHAGKLGDVTVARGYCYKTRPSIGAPGNYPIPSSVDYDLWLGPAPQAPVTRSQFHYDWHWQWAYGNGDLGNQGIHQVDVARWGLGESSLPQSVFSFGGRFGYSDAGSTPNTQVVLYDYGKKKLVFEVRGLKTAAYRGAPIGVVFEASEGTMVIASYDATAFDRNGKQIARFSGGGEDAHYDNFVRAVRSREHQELNADIEEGHVSSALCHLGNISYQLGAAIPFSEAAGRIASTSAAPLATAALSDMQKHLLGNSVDVPTVRVQMGEWLALEPENETFASSAAANAMLTRAYRGPYVVPSQEKL